MLAPADVLSVKCKFVEKMKKFLEKRKSQVDVCYCEVLPYFADAQLATTLYDADCLDIEDECALEVKADKYGPQPDTSTPTEIPCSAQATISITSTTDSCATVASVSDPVYGSVYPLINLTADSIYHDGIINLNVSGCDGKQTVSVRTGCTGDPEVCTDSQRVAGDMTFILTNPATTYPGGYIKTLRLYETNSNGVIINSPIDLDVSPANVGTWNACGTCSAVNGADLYFSSGNYKTAWLQLMQNISRTRYSGADNIAADLTQSSVWLYRYKIKHLPSSEWLGPNRNDFKVTVYNSDKGSYQVATTTVVPFTQGSFLSQTVDFDTTCGTVTASANSFAGGGATLSQYANFNFINFLTNTIPLPITAGISGATTCSTATLTASYSTTYAVDSVEWRDPSNTLISNTTTAVINTAVTGTYTFKLILDNGCEITDTIIIS